MSEQMIWDTVAALAAAITSVIVLTRRRMLSPEHRRWPDGSAALQIALALKAIFMACVAISIVSGAHVTAREAAAYVVTAVVWVVFIASLDWAGLRGSAASGRSGNLP